MEKREAIEAEVRGLPWVQIMSRLSQDRVRRIMLELEDAGFLFRSYMRKFFRVSRALLCSLNATCHAAQSTVLVASSYHAVD